MIIDADRSFKVFYAVQTCDKKSFQGQPRFCSNNRTEISKKCVTSLINSIKHCNQLLPAVTHSVLIVDDASSDQLIAYLQQLAQSQSCPNINIEFRHLPSDQSGIAGSIQHCYTWLSDTATKDHDLVYQVQDDYLFEPDAIVQMLNVWFQMYQETGTHAVISPYNWAHTWLGQYRNRSTPRTVIVGSWQYWIQIYDSSCSWLTSRQQFVQHWDLYWDFFNLILTDNDTENFLENVSINHMFTQRGVLGLCPVRSLAFHMQSELEKDPHIDWQPLWNSIDIS